MNQPVARTHIARYGLAVLLALVCLLVFQPNPRVQAAGSSDMSVLLQGFTSPDSIGTKAVYPLQLFTVDATTSPPSPTSVVASFPLPPQVTFGGVDQVEGSDTFAIVT